MSAERVIFLDVDGVLNHDGCDWSAGHRTLDPACCERIRQICDRTGARIVVSSTWRLGDGMNLLREQFGRRIIGVTPARNFGARHKEIEEWMLQHAALPLEICVVDDDADAEIPLLPFVRTSHVDGLTEAKAAEIEAAFVGASPREEVQG